jgi:hypothetical protein
VQATAIDLDRLGNEVENKVGDLDHGLSMPLGEVAPVV